MPSASALRLQIETALSRRIPSALTPAPKILRPITPTGVAEVDTLLGGGLPLGAITEMSGLESSGRTSLALSAMARITQKGGVCAWIDAGDALHVESAAAAGVDLSRLLWVRCGAAASPEETAGEKFSFSVPSLAQSPKRKGLHGQGIGGHPRHETKGLSDAVSELLKPAAAGRYDAGHQPRKHLGRSPNEPGMRAAMPEQNPRSCTQRRRFQTGFSIKENPPPPISIGYAYADSALKLHRARNLRSHGPEWSRRWPLRIFCCKPEVSARSCSTWQESSRSMSRGSNNPFGFAIARPRRELRRASCC